MIEKVSEETRQAILRKTPYAHGVTPSADGMSPSQVKKMFYAAVADRNLSALGEVDRVVEEMNREMETLVRTHQIVDEVEATCGENQVPSVPAVRAFCESLRGVRRLYFTHIPVGIADWVVSDRYSRYGYETEIALPGVRADMVPEACFDAEAASWGVLGTFCECVDGGLRLFATVRPQYALEVESLVVSVPEQYSVIVTPHAKVTLDIRDENGVYEHGSAVGKGQKLRILAKHSNTRLVPVLWVNGEEYHTEFGSLEVEHTVSGTVWIKAGEEVM